MRTGTNLVLLLFHSSIVMIDADLYSPLCLSITVFLQSANCIEGGSFLNFERDRNSLRSEIPLFYFYASAVHMKAITFKAKAVV